MLAKINDWIVLTAIIFCTGVILTVLQPWTTVLAYTGCGGAVAAAQNPTYEAQVVELVNQRRAEQSLPPMKIVPQLTDAARYHATDMTEENYFSHASQDLVNGDYVQVCSWSVRIKSYYTNSWSIGENIAYGYRTPEQVMQGWMESPGHRDNILGNYNEIGVGYVNNRWVQDFGTRRDEAPLIIEREAIQVLVPTVTLYVYGNGQEMRLRNDDQPWSEWRPFEHEFSWALQNINGERRVDIEVRSGESTLRSSDTVVLAGATAVTPTPIPPTPTATPTPTPIVLPPNMNERVYLPLVVR